MNPSYNQLIAKELNIKDNQVAAVSELLAEGATIPFISRYRKEKTGSLDEVAVMAIRDRLTQLTELDARRDSILKSLEERKLLTPELNVKLKEAQTLSKLEDIYQPFKPKRRTRATIAKEKMLEPLADHIFENQDISEADLLKFAESFINQEKEVNTVEEALAGACDILAERFTDDTVAREQVRNLFEKEAMLESKVLKTKEAEAIKYKDYFDWTEKLSTAPSHRVLAIRRGEKEGFLSFKITIPNESGLAVLNGLFVKGASAGANQVKLAIEDGYKRLLAPSMETEFRVVSKKKAEKVAIDVFAENLRELLMASPLGQKSVLGIDPGYRTGCKVVCLDAQGKLLHHDVIYVTDSAIRMQEAKEKILAFFQQFKFEAVAIGNGTASRETEAFVRSIGLPSGLPIIVVNESGASVYSASQVARDEFPNHDITVRGSVSIGRRLMDPLAELVKIDPKAIGVGQYQHDVDQGALKGSLDDTIMSCVNKVGVEVNTASKELLSYVSGVNSQIAENIVKYREENGPFKSRQELKKVTRLGPKVFEQSAGFLRISHGKNVLDTSAVHPESYPIVEQIAKDLDCSVEELIKDEIKRKNIKLDKYVTDEIGLPTLNDILTELSKPGRDPRKQFEAFKFMDGVEKLEDLKEGMHLPGIVTNVTAFGAFVDVGVHQDGLVHISQLSDSFVEDPSKVVKVGQKVSVTVIEVDAARKRIAFSMKSNPEKPAERIGRQGPKKSNNSNFSRNQAPKKQAPKNLNDDWFSSALSKKW